jgi:predicted MPP superfamily phosphohydrolase
MGPYVFFIVIFSIYGAVEFYGWQALKTAIGPAAGAGLKGAYWGLSAFFLVLFISMRQLHGYLPKHLVTYFFTVMVVIFLAKIIVLLFLFPEDIVRLVRWVIAKISGAGNPAVVTSGITRSQFLSRLAWITAALPAGSLIYGAVVNAYNYQYRKVAIKFPNLPDAFNGFRIVQLSDIHSGSFTKTKPLIDAVAKVNALNADIILFTGDLVNDKAEEMEPYIDIFKKLNAKLGVLSTTGNHDYGDYVHWDTEADKKANFESFKNVHKRLGWNLLMNQNVILDREGQKIAIIGIENYGGTGHFKRYGRMDKAYPGTEKIPFKILMSHDPSHWDVQVRPEYPDIDLTLSGHTHGFQFGIENKWIKWSPSQWMYKQWADLYQEGKQYIYVNRGFGFLGYPGRVGILPEVTEITLLKA